jgi:small-conductance mechanosensitive channel
VLVAATVVLRLLRWALHARAKRAADRTENRVDNLLADLVAHTRTLSLVAVATLVMLGTMGLDEAWERYARKAVLLVFLYQGGVWGAFVTKWIVDERARRVGSDPAAATGDAMLRLAGKVVVWSMVLLAALSNLGVDITALVTGLGIGGIAVALAVQNVLGDVFASVSILLDRPFEAGDFVITGEFMGTIEKIGLKTTRVRSLGGEQLVFSNGYLLGSPLRNYKRMVERRVVFKVGVTYQTTAAQLERIPTMVREIIEARDDTRFDRCHFAAYGDSALEIETVYYVLSPDYNLYMDIQQAINMAIYRRFEDEGISFAYPTRTLHMPDLAHRSELSSKP